MGGDGGSVPAAIEMETPMSSAVAPVAAIYCRISHDVEHRRIGVVRQEESCRRLARQRGFTAVRVFVDNDISAFSGVRRPAYQQMLQQLSAGRFAIVIAWDCDRLHRSTRELEDFIDVLDATGTPVVTVTAGEVDFATATGRMQARIKGQHLAVRVRAQDRADRCRSCLAGRSWPLEGWAAPLRLRRRPRQPRTPPARWSPRRDRA
jgi:hypothetical protein